MTPRSVQSRSRRRGDSARARESWKRSVETSTLAQTPSDANAARRRFRQLTFKEQMALCSEISETRAVELCRGYRDLIHVTYGLKVRRTPQGRRIIQKKKPCVILIVRKKLTQRRVSVKDRYELLPKEVFAYWSFDGQRRLCAVPTDVECGDEYARMRPGSEGDRRIVTENHGLKAELGVVTCAIELSNDPVHYYALSCQHVFGLIKQFRHSGNSVGSRSHLRQSSNDAIVATAMRYYGKMGNWSDLGESIDAQLARVNDLGHLKTALDGLLFNDPQPFARNESDLPRQFWVRTPRGMAKVEYRGPYSVPIDYGQAWISVVRNAELLEVQVLPMSALRSLIEGDSGSPVVSEKYGGRLLGMHIAGDDNGRGAMIPAWVLLNAKSYRGLSSSAGLILMPEIR